MEYGSDYKEGRVGFWAGCALSDALGGFKCHPSQVPWGQEKVSHKAPKSKTSVKPKELP